MYSKFHEVKQSENFEKRRAVLLAGPLGALSVMTLPTTPADRNGRRVLQLRL